MYHLNNNDYDDYRRVTRDAEVRSLSNNKSVVSFSVAVTHDYKAKNGERVTQTEFFDCAYWFSTGIAQYLTKGSLVELAGRVSARAWMGAATKPKRRKDSRKQKNRHSL